MCVLCTQPWHHIRGEGEVRWESVERKRGPRTPNFFNCPPLATSHNGITLCHDSQADLWDVAGAGLVDAAAGDAAVHERTLHTGRAGHVRQVHGIEAVVQPAEDRQPVLRAARLEVQVQRQLHRRPEHLRAERGEGMVKGCDSDLSPLRTRGEDKSGLLGVAVLSHLWDICT